jgi:hypothetical protein
MNDPKCDPAEPREPGLLPGDRAIQAWDLGGLLWWEGLGRPSAGLIIAAVMGAIHKREVCYFKSRRPRAGAKCLRAQTMSW